MSNKIIQGDCIEEMKKILDKSIPLILTDIPYDVINRKSNGLRNNPPKWWQWLHKSYGLGILSAVLSRATLKAISSKS